MAKILLYQILLLTAVVISAQDVNIKIIPITKYCLGCVCEVATGCNGYSECTNEYCGPFAISEKYWIDADRIVANKIVESILMWNSSTTDGRHKCIKDLGCATSVVQRYMEKFAQDCNGDGKIDCQDYISLHFFGKQNCTQELDNRKKILFEKCLQNMDSGKLEVGFTKVE